VSVPVQPRPPQDPEVRELLEAVQGDEVVRRSALVDVTTHPALVAADPEGGAPAGVLAYALGPTECEVLALRVVHRGIGAGGALVTAIADLARQAGCLRVWLLLPAEDPVKVGFLERHGFAVVAEHEGGAELELELRLSQDAPL
jgi:GNAT superfamily N-acetyltransferase